VELSEEWCRFFGNAAFLKGFSLSHAKKLLKPHPPFKDQT
jgi:hypothetical protein